MKKIVASLSSCMFLTILLVTPMNGAENPEIKTFIKSPQNHKNENYNKCLKHLAPLCTCALKKYNSKQLIKNMDTCSDTLSPFFYAAATISAFSIPCTSCETGCAGLITCGALSACAELCSDLIAQELELRKKTLKTKQPERVNNEI